MATPITGAISMSDVRTTLGSSGAISFNDTLVRQLLNNITGSVDLNAGHACSYINTTVTNQNIFTQAFGSPSAVASYKVLIGSSGIVNATAGNTSITIGQFPTGSTITINNFGQINGYGGAGGSAGVGSSGGDAIYASYANQTVVINNQTGAFIRAGGGGGGRGGTGGTGGTGGQGYYAAYNYRYDGSNNWVYNGSYTRAIWNGAEVVRRGDGAPGPFNGYIRGSAVSYNPKDYTTSCYIGQAYNVYTSGGSGGGGGAGGAGGRGYGADGANASGSAGSTGSGGSAGGTNAGTGGSGGTGGTGGTGGVYGTAGSTGNTGATGNAGASGNYTGGAAGAGGATGSGGGAAGRYLVKGANSVTINNSGTVAGGLA